ncbi:DMT family transporter [Sporolactobacillus shoreae]|uniref:DMT family transporter n=1 Tax=Sporolactobacillus shoreae TaxID=1465501 RepID=A0A4Z0GLH0_9BACL|nr:DMT family transporter [Sporolactobacillus shoreae]TGA97013.1 DMT family transporter [Sporolactobacillus shoreae]
MKKSVFLSPYFLLLIGVLSVSFSAIFVKWSAAPASVIAMYRMLLTVLLLLPIELIYFFKHTSLNVSEWIRLLLSGLFLALHFLLWMESLKLTSVASSTVILTLQPAFTMAGMLLFYHSRTNLGQMISLLIAVIGSLIIAWGDIGISGSALLGDSFSLLGAAAYATHLLLGQALVKKIPGEFYSFLVFLIAGLVLMGYNSAAGTDMSHYSLKEWGIFLLLALVSTVFGHTMLNICLKYIDATRITMSVVAEPVIASLLAILLLGEGVSLWQVIGGVVTLAGIALYFINPRKRSDMIRRNPSFNIKNLVK